MKGSLYEGARRGGKNIFHSKEIKLPYAQMFDDGAAFCLAATPCVST
jgi:hypothetical protein